ncbi:MAG: type II secretion system protein [Planctomycetes bacterium]|nr:type II secretion system protein [Planctomycetota bacterium]
MKKRCKRFCPGRGFTIVEMLTTIAIIAILVSMLIPALNMVRRMAAMVKQKAQFNSIGFALEAFQTDFGDYPESFDNNGNEEPWGDIYGGAQKLAEALVGWDGFGVHPNTSFRSDGMEDTTGNKIGDIQIYDTTPANLSVRLGPYLELETANAVKLTSLYETGPGAYEGNPNALVLADTFRTVTNLLTGKKTGMPILYFKADPAKFLHDYTDWGGSTYGVYQNFALVNFGAPWKQPPKFSDHPLIYNGMTYNGKPFYDMTMHPNFTVPGSERPYRSESYILISAGFDGLYGTSDDVFNFDKN